jgi:5-methyltetrahydropteroyltriglutamate--homocysteine methyltransferase
MRRSEERILTTHVGSLPRNAALADLLIRDEAGEAVDRAELVRQSESAVRHVVGQQVACGVDVVNDGEQPRVGFQTYVAQRMKGFGGESARPRPRDYADFPAFAARMRERLARAARYRTRRRRSPTSSMTTSRPPSRRSGCFGRRWTGWPSRPSTPS